MELTNNLAGEILLVGEANFSFTLSLCKHYLTTGCRITTSCFESRDRLNQIFGRELIDTHLAALWSHPAIASVQFGVDATRLEATTFSTTTSNRAQFDRIYFMFPHVSGRSNLRKNRTLMFEFFRSCAQVLRPHDDAAILVTLAGGQGGTIFERDPLKRCNRDSWRIVELAAQNGFVLSSCEPFRADAFECYTSTGFRSQHKSFSVEDALVHKFERSLRLDPLTCSLDQHSSRFHDLFLSANRANDLTHPFVQLRDFLAAHLSSPTQSFVVQSIDSTALSPNQKRTKTNEESGRLNVSGRLVVRNSNEAEIIKLPTHEDYAIDNLKFEIVAFHSEITPEQIEIYSSRLSSLLDPVDSQAYTMTSSQKNDSTSFFECRIDASRLLTTLFKLPDSRILFSDDRRTLVPVRFELDGFKLDTICRPFSIDPSRWEHDVSFWLPHNNNNNNNNNNESENENENEDGFDFGKFLDTIRQTCYSLVSHVRLVDRFDDVANRRRSYCFRLVYQSCDRALDWQTTRIVQDRLREKFSEQNQFVLR